ncbi:hypothetical protein BsWGS_26439 [Bradybaena similaris]
MIPSNVADVAHVLSLHCNLHSLCLLLGVTFTAVFTVCWFKWLKGTRGKRKPEFKLNCWFCNEDVEVEPERANSWRCLHCQQYNGFTEDGDYNQQLAAQFQVSELKTPTICSPSDFITGTSVLCESCAQNQVLKLRQIAAFVPFSEANYDEEVEVYRRYLEHRYSLCDKCRKQVSNYLADQDQKLVSKMTSDQLSLLERLKEKAYTGRGDQHMRNTVPAQPVLPRMMLGLCVCAAIVHVIFSWVLYSAPAAPGGPSAGVSYITRTVEPSLSVVPDWLAVWGESISACCGCAFCFGGLLAVGKHSLYPVDAVHLLLWLVLTLLTSISPAAILSWLHLTRGRILIAGSNVLLSLACCLRSRHPRHFTVPTVRKKQMNPPEKPVKESSPDRESSGSAKGIHKRQVVPPSTLPSPAYVGGDGISQVEHVQQNLESLNLGLTRRSKSTSSVWSLPAVVTASSVSPDSTTGRMSPSCIQRSQSVLSPSRLSALEMDSGLTADGRHVSRSSSPWMQIEQGLHSRVNRSRNHNNKVIELSQLSDGKPYQGSSFQSYRYVPPAADTSVGSTSRSLTSNGIYRSGFRSSVSSVLPDVGPCDSQTPENGLPQLFASMGGNFQHYSANVVGKGSNPQVGPSRQDKAFVSRGLDNSKFKSPDPVEATLNSTPRRSQRIAMREKLPKPWPLKKSLSCSIVCDKADGGRSGFWEARDFVVSSQVWGRHCTENAVNSTLVSDLLPIQEMRVGSHACQTTLRNKDERLKCDNVLVKRHPCRQDISCQVTEFSDDDCDDSDRSKEVTFRNRISNIGLRRNDLPWTWLLIGALMGASLTTNVFLACQRWWAHAEPF